MFLQDGVRQVQTIQDRILPDHVLQDRVLRTVTVPLRVEWSDDQIRTLQMVVIDLDQFTEELHLDGQTIGFIHRAGRIFVASAGTRFDQAEECAQCLLWDKAAAILVTTFGHLPEPEQPDPLAPAPQNTTGDPDTGHTPARQRPVIHEMSR